MEISMNWEAIGAMGDFMGAIVVIVSVVYLAAQIRQSNRHAEGSTELSWVHGLNEIWDRWTVESTMTAIRKGLKDFDALSKNEQAVFHMQVGALVNHCMAAEQLWQRRLIAFETREAAVDVLARILRTPGGRRYWELDMQASPEAPALIKEIEKRSPATWDQLFPWWHDEDDSESRDPAQSWPTEGADGGHHG
jgi:hypothetical protein